MTVNNVAPTVTPASSQTAIVAVSKFFNLGSFSDPGLSDNPWSVDVNWGDSTTTTFSTSSQGTLTPKSHTYSTSGTFTVTVKVTDKDLGTDSKTFTVTVPPNVPPVVTITAPLFGSTYAKPATVNLAASFVDPDTGQLHTCSIDWDDGTVTMPTVSETAATCSQSHSYTAAGVYTIVVKICDNAGGCGTTTVWVIVYDPNAGFVTGGGWIDVVAGSYRPDQTLSGRANFGFNSQYKKNATVPTGQTEFNFQVGNLNFHSESYTWLAVSGYKAQFKGTGTINGSGSYDFTLTAYDGKVSGGGGVDKFRIRITNGNNGNAVVFDNRFPVTSTDMDTADPQAISGGTITIHKA